MKSTSPRTGELLDELLFDHFKEAADRADDGINRVLERLRTEGDETSLSAMPMPAAVRPARRAPMIVGVAAATAIVSLFVAVFLPLNRSLARIETVGAGLQRVSENGATAMRPGETLALNDVIRSHAGEGATLKLADGSEVEMRPTSQLALGHATDGIRIRLDRGSVIVTAAEQREGRLYVETRDLVVSVIGTAFLVNAEEAGSRVSVLQGEVRVQLGAALQTLVPGEQVASNPLMEIHPLSHEIAWSREAEAHISLLQRSTAAEPTDTVQEFEAASIRSIPSGIPTQVRCRGIDGELAPMSASTAPAPLGRCQGSSVSLRAIVAAAYDIEEQRISGASDAIQEGFYRLEAVAENAASVTTQDLRLMLQGLLRDRFKLKFHRETKEAQGYVVQIGNEGRKFRETTGDEEPPLGMPSGSWAPPAPGQTQLTPTVFRGRFRLKRLADSWSRLLEGLPVIDRTGLTGIYDISLTLPLAVGIAPRPTNAMGEDRAPQPVRLTVTVGPRVLASALEEQLGLRLESARVPVEYLVVDSFEEPSEK